MTRLRDGQLTLNPELTTALLGMVDAVRQMLGSIEVSGGRRARRHEANCHADPHAGATVCTGEERGLCRAGGSSRRGFPCPTYWATFCRI